MKDENKTNVGDTLRNMKDNPKEAMKEDYNQTKADMKAAKENAQEKAKGALGEEDSEEDTYNM
jgi:hypothetical protein